MRIEAKLREMCEAELINAIQVQEKHAREEAINEVKDEVVGKYEEQEATDEVTLKQVKEILDKIVKDEVRRLITVEKVRPDGRKIDEIRPLSSQVGIITAYPWFRIIYTWTNTSIKYLYLRSTR